MNFGGQRFRQRFPGRLREARERAGLTQGQLAARVDRPPSTIGHFESGERRPAFDNLVRLALALDVDADYLLGLRDKPRVEPTDDPLFRSIQDLSAPARAQAANFVGWLATLSPAKCRELADIIPKSERTP